jgi:hypothetical protein
VAAAVSASIVMPHTGSVTMVPGAGGVFVLIVIA